jgi:hypothetical protein
MDRLNEFFNLKIKVLIVIRRTLIIDTTKLFYCTTLTSSYCTNLKVTIEAAFGKYSNGRH